MLNVSNHQGNTSQNHNEISVRMAIIKMNTNNKWWGCEEKGTFVHCWEPLYTVENSMQVSQSTKNRTTIWPSYSTPGYIFKRNKNTNSKRYMHPNVHSSIIYNCQDVEATSVSINRWIKKMVYIYNGILLSH